MSPLIECIPNFSEGRRVEVVDAIVAAIRATPGVVVLDRTMDADHNRAVVTFVGDAPGVAEAAFRAIATAATLIDLDAHHGAHPRIGATDVAPFVPLADATMADCITLARQVGERVGRELRLPVYLYEGAAMRETNRNLADVRRGGYELLKAEIATQPERAPDFGPRALGKAGAVAIGARQPLIAFNVNMDTTDVSIAKAIAKRVRASSGGLPCVKALGLWLETRGLAQVSLNLTDYTQTGLAHVFSLIAQEAERYGVPIVESELIGLAPQQALWDAAATYLKLKDFSPSRVLEYRIAEALGEILVSSVQSSVTSIQSPVSSPQSPVSSVQFPTSNFQLPASNFQLPTSDLQIPIANNQLPFTDFLDDLAAPTPTPGGGSACAHVGAVAAALLLMYVGLALKRMERDGQQSSAVYRAMHNAHEAAQHLQAALRVAVAEDVRAYEALRDAYRIPKNEAVTDTRAPAIQRALIQATEVPLRVAEQTTEVLRWARAVMGQGLKSAQSDLRVAVELAQGAIRGVLLTAQANMRQMNDAEQVRVLQRRMDVLTLAKEA